MLNSRGHVLSFDSSPIDENSALDSSSYNAIINNLKSSTLRCINRSRDVNYKLMKFNKALTAENYNMMSIYNSMKINYTKQPNTAIITGFDKSQDSNSSVKLVDSANVDFDPLTGQIVIAPNSTNSKWSKVVRYLDKNGKNKASKDIRILFGTSNSEFTDNSGLVELPDDSDIYSMLDGYSDSFWLADVTASNNYKLMLQFPASLKPFVSYLSLLPFPAFGFTIDSVYITDSSNVSHRIDDGTSNVMGIMNTHFKPMSWGGTLVINMKATSNVIGIADLDIGLEDYFQSGDNSTSVSTDKLSSYVVYELTGDFKSSVIKNITGVNLFDFGLYGNSIDINAQRKSNYFTATIYKTTNSDWDNTLVGIDVPEKTVYTKEPQPVDSQWVTFNKNADERFFIKFTLKKFLGQTPTFRGVSVSYN